MQRNVRRGSPIPIVLMDAAVVSLLFARAQSGSKGEKMKWFKRQEKQKRQEAALHDTCVVYPAQYICLSLIHI
eukprot:5545425-Amphidinium_carterae.1